MSRLYGGQRKRARRRLGGTSVEKCATVTGELQRLTAPSQFFSTEQTPTPRGRGRSGGAVGAVLFRRNAARQTASRALTHLSVSVADGLCEGAPSLSVFHLHRCIMGQQQVGTLCIGQTGLQVTTPNDGF